MYYEKGEIVAGKVTGITKYGIFVQIDENVSGLIHISEISPYFVQDIEKYVHLGEVIRVKIVEIQEDGKYCLSIKGIDYRILKDRKSKIEKSDADFSSLAMALNEWINQSYKKLQKKQIGTKKLQN